MKKGNRIVRLLTEMTNKFDHLIYKVEILNSTAHGLNKRSDGLISKLKTINKRLANMEKRMIKLNSPR